VPIAPMPMNPTRNLVADIDASVLDLNAAR